MDESAGTRSRPVAVVEREDCGPDTLPGRCTCREAVTRAFHGMLCSGAPPAVALDVASRIYRHHHPQATFHTAYLTVEAWLSPSHLH